MCSGISSAGLAEVLLLYLVSIFSTLCRMSLNATIEEPFWRASRLASAFTLSKSFSFSSSCPLSIAGFSRWTIATICSISSCAAGDMLASCGSSGGEAEWDGVFPGIPGTHGGASLSPILFLASAFRRCSVTLLHARSTILEKKVTSPVRSAVSTKRSTCWCRWSVGSNGFSL